MYLDNKLEILGIKKIINFLVDGKYIKIRESFQNCVKDTIIFLDHSSKRNISTKKDCKNIKVEFDYSLFDKSKARVLSAIETINYLILNSSSKLNCCSQIKKDLLQLKDEKGFEIILKMNEMEETFSIAKVDKGFSGTISIKLLEELYDLFSRFDNNFLNIDKY